jgi:hypothetical protein
MQICIIYSQEQLLTRDKTAIKGSQQQMTENSNTITKQQQ